MSASAAAAAAAPPSRAEILAAKKRTQELQAQQRALEEQMNALSVGSGGVALMSTLDASLGRDLEKVGDLDTLVQVKSAMNHLENVEIDYDEEDMLDVDFWEHGVVPPPPIAADVDPKKLMKEALRTSCAEWETAFRQLEIKFIKRAIYAHDLKQLYASKRAQVSHTYTPFFLCCSVYMLLGVYADCCVCAFVCLCDQL